MLLVGMVVWIVWALSGVRVVVIRSLVLLPVVYMEYRYAQSVQLCRS